MDKAAELKTLIACPVDFTLDDGAAGEAELKVDEANVTVTPKFGEPLVFSPREIVQLSVKDYRISMLLSSGEKLDAFNAGGKFEDLARIVSKQRNEVVLKDMLMQEQVRKAGAQAEYSFMGATGACEPRLYETGLVILPEMGEPARVNYADIAGIQAADFKVNITMESGAVLSLWAIGREYTPFCDTLSEAMTALNERTQKLLKEIMPPEVNSLMLRKLSRLLKEGRAAKRSDIEAVSPKAWEALEGVLERGGMKEEYAFLSSIAQKGRICVGFKRELKGEEAGDYIWLLAPVYDADPSKPGNAVIMEAVKLGVGEKAPPEAAAADGGEEVKEEAVKDADAGAEGKATYIFRIMGRKEYVDAAGKDEAADAFLRTVNDAMLAINFRREPVYLSDKKLQEPEYIRYLYSIARLPQLKALRASFIGRVIHLSPAQWKKGVMDALSFNVRETDDAKRWKE